MARIQSLNLDTVYSLLAESRRRYLLYHLSKAEYGNIENLARHIAAWENEESVRAVSEDDHDRVAISLVHNHLPRLAEHDVVEFDARSGDVVTAANFEELEPFVEQASSAESPAEVPETSHLSVLYSKPPDEPYVADDA